MARYWVSWYTGNYEEEGCTEPPFTYWTSGQRSRPDDGLTPAQLEVASKIMDEDEYDEYLNTHSKDDCTICALIDAPSEEAIWEVVAKHFPDYEYRFCEERPADYTPGDRFQAEKIITSLTKETA